MPFHDLNVAYIREHADLSHTLSFQHELGYNVVCIAIAVTGELPPSPQVIPLSALTIPSSLQVLTRLTLTISDTAQNHRLSNLSSSYDILALRPTTEKTFQLCCQSLECDLISLDFSKRLPCILKFTTVSAALQRGVRFEICYSPGITGGSDARTNLISGAASLIRATRGRGIILSSNARNALGVRAPWDIINLAQVWGLGQERGKEALCEEAGKVVRLAKIKRTSYRGVVDIIDNGPGNVSSASKSNNSAAKAGGSTVNPRVSNEADGTNPPDATPTNGIKRKASTSDTTTTTTTFADKPISKREKQRRAKKARLEGTQLSTNNSDTTQAPSDNFPLKHEIISTTTKDYHHPPPTTTTAPAPTG